MVRLAALEAAGFRREVILMPEDKLNEPENLEKRMLIMRSNKVADMRFCGNCGSLTKEGGI